LKIVRIVSELDFGGVEQVLANSGPALVQNKGVYLFILVLGQGGRIADQLTRQGISVQILGSNSRIPNISLILRASKILFRVRPDVVHTQGAEANFHGILAAKFVGVPRIIGEEIGIPNHHSYWKWIFRYVYRQAHQVIAISEAVKGEIVRLGEVAEEKVKVLYNPVNSKGKEIREKRIDIREQGSKTREEGIERIARKEFVQWINSVRGQDEGERINKTDKSFVFVTTCRLVPIKNLERLIQAFGGLVKANPDRELRMRIVGEGPERENLELRIQNSELGNQVEILGFQSNVWPFLEEADAFVLPSLQEGSSVSLAEAMSAGLPSIVTQMGGSSEILGDSNSGIFIDPLDIDSIQKAMQQMIDFSIEEREVMGDRAKKEAQRFSVENYIESLVAIYSLSSFRFQT